MIVRSTIDGWQITYQSHHALISGVLASRLLPLKDLPFPHQTAAAATLHDDFKLPFAAGSDRYLSNVGAPLNFTEVPMNSDQRFEETCQRLEDAEKKHRWIRLLLSRHAEFLYGDQDTSDSLAELLKSEKRRRRAILKQLNHSADDLEACYEWLRWCDRCSLILCGDDIPAMGRRLEIATTEDGTRYDIFDAGDGICIDPWPMDSEVVTFDLEVRNLSQLQFADDAELKAALDAASVTSRWVSLRAPEQ